MIGSVLLRAQGVMRWTHRTFQQAGCYIGETERSLPGGFAEELVCFGWLQSPLWHVVVPSLQLCYFVLDSTIFRKKTHSKNNILQMLLSILINRDPNWTVWDIKGSPEPF